MSLCHQVGDGVLVSWGFGVDVDLCVLVLVIGSGNLVMLRDTGYNGAEEKGDDADASATSGEGDGSTDVSSFQGVAIEVMFPGKGNTQRMEKLSGGEKAVVALALIFAIQVCMPVCMSVVCTSHVHCPTALRSGTLLRL